MIIRGKEIDPHTVSMWLNVVSFIASLVFYISLAVKTQGTEIIAPANSLHDSSLIIDARLHERLRELKATQDSILAEIRGKQTQLQKTAVQTAVIRHHITQTIHNDWDSLSPQKQAAYIDQILSNLKNKNP